MLAPSERPIYLASRSPRRQELLGQIGVKFEVMTLDVDESVLQGEAPRAYVERLARAKAEAGWMRVERDRLPRRLDDHVQYLGDIAQAQRANIAITQPLLQLLPIHRTSPRRYSAVDPRDNLSPVATSAPRANSAFIRDGQIRVNK